MSFRVPKRRRVPKSYYRMSVLVKSENVLVVLTILRQYVLGNIALASVRKNKAALNCRKVTASANIGIYPYTSIMYGSHL